MWGTEVYTNILAMHQQTSALTLANANLTRENIYSRAKMSQKSVCAYLAALHTAIREVYNLEEEQFVKMYWYLQCSH